MELEYIVDNSRNTHVMLLRESCIFLLRQLQNSKSYNVSIRGKKR